MDRGQLVAVEVVDLAPVWSAVEGSKYAFGRSEHRLVVDLDPLVERDRDRRALIRCREPNIVGGERSVLDGPGHVGEVAAE